MNSRRLRIGVAGAGKWGMNLVRVCADAGVLAAVCDGDLHPLEDVRSRYEGVKLFCDFSAMLSLAHLDAVVVAAPAPLHAKLALAAIDAGLDVLVEKPLALNAEDARSVVEAARAAKCKLAVGHLLLYHPAVQTMLKMTAAGAIGDLRHFRSRRTSWGRLRAHEDVWWSFAPHDVAVMLEAFGSRPVSATSAPSAFVRRHVADVAYADYAFAEGRSAHLEVAWIDPDKGSRIDLFGSRGVLTFADSVAGPALTHVSCGDRIDARGEPELVREETTAVAFPAGEPLALEIEAFCRMVRGGRTVPADGDEGLAVIETLAMAGARGYEREEISCAS